MAAASAWRKMKHHQSVIGEIFIGVASKAKMAAAENNGERKKAESWHG
jgi:hypothetical protein